MLKHNLQIVQNLLRRGLVIPASPLALSAKRQWDERRQLGLWRYYAAAGAGGIAMGVHTTQFAIRDPKIGLFRPLLALAAEEIDRLDALPGDMPTRSVGMSQSQHGATNLRSVPDDAVPPREPLVRIAGICGQTEQAVGEATIARDLGFHAGLLSLGAMRDADEDSLLAHCRAVAAIIPLLGFYLQPAVGGRLLPYGFWCRFAEIENVAAIKIAPFNRYQTLDVVRAVAESGRDDIALYTGNDDNIVIDLLTPYRFSIGDRVVERRIVGGLLGHWAVWTRRAVELLEACHAGVEGGMPTRSVGMSAHDAGWLGQSEACPSTAEGGCATAQKGTGTSQSSEPVPFSHGELLQLAVEVTDANAAFFDVAHHFAGCIAGLHEVLRRQGLLDGIWCLDPNETLSPGQSEEIDRVYRMYSHLSDDEFVAEHRDQWLR